MFILVPLLEALSFVVHIATWFLLILLFVRVLLSYFNPSPGSGLVRFIWKTTDPLLYYARKVMPRRFRLWTRPLDLSVIVAAILVAALAMVLQSIFGDIIGHRAIRPTIFLSVLVGVILGIGYALHVILFICVLILVARILIAYAVPDPFNPLVHFVMAVSDPLVGMVETFVPASVRRRFGRFDWPAAISAVLLVLVYLMLTSILGIMVARLMRFGAIGPRW